MILLVAVFRMDRSLTFPYAPSTPPSLPAPNEFGQEVPEILFLLVIPAVDGHKPVAAL